MGVGQMLGQAHSRLGTRTSKLSGLEAQRLPILSPLPFELLCNFLPSSSFLPRARSSPPPSSVLAEAFNRQLGRAVLSEASKMEQKRKASDDAPETSRPPARMRSASADDEDVSPHGGGSGSGGERVMGKVVPSPQPLPMAGMDANLTDNSGSIDSFARDDGEEASSPIGNGEELAAAAGQPQPLFDQDQPVAGEELAAAAGQPQPLLDRPVAGAEPPQPLPNDERSVIDAVVPGPATAAMVAAEYIWCSGCLSQTASVRLVPEMHVCHCVRCHFSPAGMPYCEHCDAAHH